MFPENFRVLGYVSRSHQSDLSKPCKHWDIFLSHCTSMVNNLDPWILISHCRYSSSETSTSSPSIIFIDHIPRHGQRHSYSFLILLGIFIHSTLVYSYHHFVSFPQSEYQLSFSQSFVSLSFLSTTRTQPTVL